MNDAARKIRVLWLIKGLGKGGAEQLLVEHATAPGHHDMTVEVAYVLSWKTALVEPLTTLGIRTRSLGVRRLGDARWVWRLHRVLDDGAYDVVHVHSPQVAAVARLLVRAMPRGRRPRLVFTEHNRWPSYHPITRWANRMTYGLNDAAIAVSDDVRDSVAPRWRLGVEVVVHGIDLDAVRAFASHREAVRAELGIAPDELLVLTIANLRATKNYPGLLAAAKLVTERALPVRFAAAGQGPLEGEVRALHAQLGLGEHFTLLGYRADASRLLAGADVFALASHHEGLPLTMMEAFALGVPVVAPAVGGLRDAVHSGENGILVPPGDPTALADAIGALVDGSTRAQLAAGARASGDRYSSTHAAARLDDLYRALAG